MNDEHTNLVDGLDDGAPVVGAEAATLVPGMVEAHGNGKLLVDPDTGEQVEDEAIGFVQVGEDA